MCGIFSYFGKSKNPVELVIKGLKKLEYRGYDSWGVAIKEKNGISIHKQVGKIGDYNAENFKKDTKIVIDENIPSIAIGHSRWATHGKVNKTNSHPHSSSNNEIVLVHNGVCENYLEIKKKLKNLGHKFKSETDTEVIAHLLEENLKNHKIKKAIIETNKELKGRYAFVVILKDKNELIAVRNGSPLIIGKEGNSYYIASDIPAFIEHTNHVMYLDNEQFVIFNEETGASFYNLNNGEKIEKRVVKIDLSPESAEKLDYPHFMIKEIMEQKPKLLKVANECLKPLKELTKLAKEAEDIYILGCGTAGKVAMIGEYLLADLAHKKATATFGSEFKKFAPFINKKSLVIGISQSGETADTLEAFEIAKEKGAKLASIINVESSTMARMSDAVVPIMAGPEKAVASTKATTAQLAVMILFANDLIGKIKEGQRIIVDTSSQISDMLNPRYEKHIEKLAKRLLHVESMYIIGRGPNYPMALEAAIKLQEVSYIHAEGFAAGELKHGPIALITKGTPVIALVANDQFREETISNAIEVKSRGAYVIGVAPKNNEAFDFWIKVPDNRASSAILNIIPIQLLAYKLGVLKGHDPDKPRNLAKSVTVK